MSPVFAVHIYHDELLAQRLIRQLRQFYPASTILCISDGYEAPDLRQFAAEMNVAYVPGIRLKLPQHGGGWIKRLFNLAKGKGDPLIRMDPDSYLWRSFNYFPEADIFGTTIGLVNQQLNIVRGGCQGFSQAAIAKILESRLLDDPCYRDPIYFAYRRYSDYRFADESENNELVLSVDPIIGHIAKRLGLKLEHWDDIKICFRDPLPDNSSLQWAVTHPHRELINV